MTNQTGTIVKFYFHVGVRETLGGSGEFLAITEQADRLYTDPSDVIKAHGGSEYVSTTNTGWRNHKDTELVECINDVSGNMNNEPEILVAMRDDAGKVTVFGIDTIFGYMQEDEDGEYLPLESYPDTPKGNILA